MFALDFTMVLVPCLLEKLSNLHESNRSIVGIKRSFFLFKKILGPFLLG